MEKRILLNKEDFSKLVNGEIVEKGDVMIALKDIGFDQMQNELSNAKEKFSLKIDY